MQVASGESDVLLCIDGEKATDGFDPALEVLPILDRLPRSTRRDLRDSKK